MEKDVRVIKKLVEPKKLVGTIKRGNEIIKEVWKEAWSERPKKEFEYNERCPFCGNRIYPISIESDKLRGLLPSLKKQLQDLYKIMCKIEQLKTK